jgi:Ca-activated chloride channel family protein
VPIAILAVAVAALVVAAARPQRTVAVPVEQAQILLMTDVSGSMLAKDVTPSRLIAVQRAAREFVKRVPQQVKIGVMAFNTAPQVLQSPTQDRDAVDAALQRLRSSGGTATGDAIQTGVRLLQQAPRSNGRVPPSAIVLLSDGASTKGVNPVQAARDAGRRRIPITTVALGTPNGTITVKRKDGRTEVHPVPPDPATMRAIAQASGGRTATATDAGTLGQVYKRLGSQLGRRKVPREITSGFAGAALALLAAGSALSLRWFGRLI